MKLIINKNLGVIIGTSSGANTLPDGMIYIDPPEGFDIMHANDYTLVDGVLVADQQAVLLRTKMQKLREIRTHFDGIVAGLKASVAPYEVATWDIQRNELTAYLANVNNPTPYVDSLASARGETRDALFGKIKAKVEAMAALQGRQQMLEKQVEAATDVGALGAITY
jgi:hypothetical protein